MTPSRAPGCPSRIFQQVFCGRDTISGVTHVRGGGATQSTRWILTRTWTQTQSPWWRSAERPRPNTPERDVRARWDSKPTPDFLKRGNEGRPGWRSLVITFLMKACRTLTLSQPLPRAANPSPASERRGKKKKNQVTTTQKSKVH